MQQIYRGNYSTGVYIWPRLLPRVNLPNLLPRVNLRRIYATNMFRKIYSSPKIYKVTKKEKKT